VFNPASGNITDIDYKEDGSSVKNYVFGGGSEDQGLRLRRDAYDAQSIQDWSRIEVFNDASSADTSAKLDLENNKKLAELSRGEISISFKINNAGQYQYGEHYTFGDKVTCVWPDAGIQLTNTITGVTVNFQEGQPMDIDLSIGHPNLNRLFPGKALANYITVLRKGLSVLARH